MITDDDIRALYRARWHEPLITSGAGTVGDLCTMALSASGPVQGYRAWCAALIEAGRPVPHPLASEPTP